MGEIYGMMIWGCGVDTSEIIKTKNHQQIINNHQHHQHQEIIY
jgi:hypothetical protein